MTKRFEVEGKTWRIILTLHILDRIRQRGIDAKKVVPAILNYLKNRTVVNGDVMLEVTSENFSLVLNIRKNNIKLITVIDKINCIAKPGTLKVAI